MGRLADIFDCGPVTAEWGNIGKADEGSLDAARSVHILALPNRYWRIEEWDGAWTVTIPIDRDVSFEATSEYSPGRAWLIAILEALIAQEATRP